jgi:predicted DNA-binding protein (UPF0251 family)
MFRRVISAMIITAITFTSAHAFPNVPPKSAFVDAPTSITPDELESLRGVFDARVEEMEAQRLLTIHAIKIDDGQAAVTLAKRNMTLYPQIVQDQGDVIIQSQYEETYVANGRSYKSCLAYMLLSTIDEETGERDTIITGINLMNGYNDACDLSVPSIATTVAYASETELTSAAEIIPTIRKIERY